MFAPQIKKPARASASLSPSDIPEEKRPLPLSLLIADPDSLDQLAAYTRAELHFLFFGSPDAERKWVDYEPATRINVTLRTHGHVRGSMSGVGQSLLGQLKDSVRRSAQDARFSGPLVRADFDHVTVEVWLQTSAEEIMLESRDSESAIFLGIDGVEVQLGSAFAYYKPSVAITQGYRSCQDLFSALCKKASLTPDSWKSGECSLKKTSWIHLCETPRGVVRMEALRPYGSAEFASKDIAEWVVEGAQYLSSNQQADGGFCYNYQPFTDSSKREEANPVRSSGCAYSIAAAVSSPHLIGSPSLAKCADVALEAIIERAEPLPGGGMYIATPLRSGVDRKLGTTALLLLALLTKRFEHQYTREVDQLLFGIRSCQGDSGLFQCSYGNDGSTDSQINFFPGQALLALVKSAERGDPDSWAAVQKAFNPYREHFRRSPATAFVGWQAEVWSRAAVRDLNQDYASFVFEQIDWLLQFQIDGKESLPYAGGFSWNGRPPNYSSVVYTEAIARAAALAFQLDDGRLSRYLNAFHAGLAFCSRLRLSFDQAAFFPNPLRAVGGTATSLSDLTVRSDFVQHTITLALAALDSPILLPSGA